MDRRESLGYQVNHLSRLLAMALRERIASCGVVPGQFAQLLALYENDGVTQNDLCDQVRIDQSTMAHTLKRMHRDGLIDRHTDPTDRRRAVITLTPLARDLECDLTLAAEHTNAAATRGFSDEEVAASLHLITRMIANLEGESTTG
jgi:DNA-binding MarR family transcriptional regulator